MSEPERRKLAVLIPSALVAAGLAAGTAQVLIFRELLVACQGNEISMALMLSAWLLWGALGSAWLGRRRAGGLSDSAKTLGNLGFWFWWVALFSLGVVRFSNFTLAVLMPKLVGALGLSGGPLSSLLTIAPGQALGLPQIVGVAFLGTWLSAMLNGAQFAAGSRAYLDLRQQGAETVGRSYALDALGHLLGGTMLAWLALQYVDPLLMVLLIGLANLVVGFLLQTTTETAFWRRPIWIILALMALIVAALYQGYRLVRLTNQSRWFHDQILLDERRTVYGDMALTRFGDEGSYLYYNGLPAASSPAPEDLQLAVDFALLQHPAPRRILMVGGGTFGGLAAALRHRPEQIDYLELDPELFDFVYPWLLPEDRQAMARPEVN